MSSENESQGAASARRPPTSEQSAAEAAAVPAPHVGDRRLLSAAQHEHPPATATIAASAPPDSTTAPDLQLPISSPTSDMVGPSSNTTNAVLESGMTNVSSSSYDGPHFGKVIRDRIDHPANRLLETARRRRKLNQLPENLAVLRAVLDRKFLNEKRSDAGRTPGAGTTHSFHLPAGAARVPDGDDHGDEQAATTNASNAKTELEKEIEDIREEIDTVLFPKIQQQQKKLSDAMMQNEDLLEKVKQVNLQKQQYEKQCRQTKLGLERRYRDLLARKQCYNQEQAHDRPPGGFDLTQAQKQEQGEYQQEEVDNHSFLQPSWRENFEALLETGVFYDSAALMEQLQDKDGKVLHSSEAKAVERREQLLELGKYLREWMLALP
ncbi:unnamed protein product [Amoebophrya sp. A120]|nr:unnamed protein product [Amoebophrya sp. A120]|eukprot:GSA120T00017183001.1